MRFTHSLLKPLYAFQAVRFCSGEIAMQSEFYHLMRNTVVANLSPWAYSSNT